MVVKALVVGVLSTAFMDFGAFAISRVGLVRKPAFCLLGRWLCELLNGRIIHRDTDIRSVQSRRFETPLGALAHYLIGTVLALIFLISVHPIANQRIHFWHAISFGLITNVFPWLIMYPSMGFGFFAKRAPPHAKLFTTSLVSHLNYGLGLWLACLLFWR